MTLRCTCGSGALKITEQNYNGGSALESYKCNDCGGKGTLFIGEDGTQKSGCLQ